MRELETASYLGHRGKALTKLRKTAGTSVTCLPSAVTIVLSLISRKASLDGGESTFDNRLGVSLLGSHVLLGSSSAEEGGVRRAADRGAPRRPSKLLEEGVGGCSEAPVMHSTISNCCQTQLTRSQHLSALDHPREQEVLRVLSQTLTYFLLNLRPRLPGTFKGSSKVCATGMCWNLQTKIHM